MKKTAVIFGIAGQTGSYLAEHLLNNDYNVFGMVRRNSTPEHQENRIAHLEDKIETFYGDLHDSGSIMKLLSLVEYNSDTNTFSGSPLLPAALIIATL